MSGVAGIGANSGDPRHRIDSNDQILDNFSWKLNKHAVKFGADFHRTSINQFLRQVLRGKLEFSSLDDFLAGSVDGGFQYFGDTTRHTYENNFGFYAQDNFRLTSQLTLNYGLRWDYFGVVQEKNNLLSNFTTSLLAK